MAKTKASERRQAAMALRGLFLLGGLAIYFYTPGLHWGFFFGILIGAVVLGEIFGTVLANALSTPKRAKKPTAAASAGNQPVRKKQGDQELVRADVHTLSGSDFERLMELYYKDQGYSVERVGGAGDHEVDLILKGKEGYKIAVQCKRWKKDVGNDIVLRLKAGKQVHGCYDAWIVTTSNFTKAAREAADRLNIKLINGLALEDKLESWRKTRSK